MLENAGKLEGTDELPLRLAGALRWFWRMRGHFHEGRHSLVKALQRCPSKPTAARAGALLALSLLTNALGELVTALQPAEESAAIFQELGDSPGQAEALLIAGLTQVWQGEAEAGSARMEKALALYRTAGDPWDVAYALYRLGAAISDFQGNMEGRRMLEESAGILESLGESYIYISVLISIAILDNGIGDYELATQRLEKALAVGREIDHPWGVADALCNLGGAKRIQGRYPEAQAHLEAAQRIYQEHGSSTWEIDVLCALSEIDISQGSLSAARQRLQTAAGRLESSGHRWLEALVRYFQGLLLYYEGEPAESAGLLEAVIEIAEHGEYRPDLARALVSLGRARLAMGQAPAAVESFVRGMQQFNQLGHRLGVATALEGLAAARAAQEDHQQAVALASAAHSLRTALGAPLPPVDRPAQEAMLAACRTRLGEEEFAEAWKRGAAMSAEHIGTGLLS